MAEIPERIGPYRVISKVGEGGMGVVYKAEDPRLERIVALKVIREFEGDTSRRRRFWQEARAAAQVAHPNACRIYDIAEEQDCLVLVMEFIEGESLARFPARPGGRPGRAGLAVRAGSFSQDWNCPPGSETQQHRAFEWRNKTAGLRDRQARVLEHAGRNRSDSCGRHDSGNVSGHAEVCVSRTVLWPAC